MRLNLDKLSSAEQAELVVLLDKLATARRQNRIDTFYPESGPLRRELYQKHMEFFRAGATYRERCAMGGNRTGKSEGIGAYETALHLTGTYPSWWEGRKFNHPVKAWAAGKTNQTTRDIVQNKLLGNVKNESNRKRIDGTGMVRAERIDRPPTWKSGVPDLIDTIPVKHASGDYSMLSLKSYEQGRGAFEGTEQDVIWLDEECKVDIYSECLMRTMTTNGLIYITFTPLEGATETVMQFLPGEMLNKLIESAKPHAGR